MHLIIKKFENHKQAISEININFEIPNGQVLTLNEERFKTPEFLFKPELFGIEADGFDTAIYHTIMDCDISIKK